MENNTVNLLKELTAVFPVEQLKWRIISVFEKENKLQGIIAPYIDSRNLMNRFDNVLGCNWSCDYKIINCNSLTAVECTISVNTAEGRIARADIADIDMNSSFGNGSILKSGYSNSFKRAAVAWGVGRYLYSLGNFFVPIENNLNGPFKINGEFKINGKRTFVKGSFKAPSKKLISELKTNGFDVTSIAGNTTAITNNVNNYNTPNSKPVDKELLENKEAVTELLKLLDIKYGQINPIINHFNSNENNLESASLQTLQRLKKALSNIKSFFDICFGRNLETSDVYTLLKTVVKKNVNSLSEIILDLEDSKIREELRLRLESYKKIA